jgi:3-hydroxymyristoyl/3-hydroxydecanoyl-(acyl carrier protein) dehydratase
MRFSIAPTHPALDGHFPGRPIVPAVVILDEVLAAAAHAATGPVIGIVQAKFSAFLRPAETCVVSFEPSRQGLRFLCRAETRTIASGLLAIANGAS